MDIGMVGKNNSLMAGPDIKTKMPVKEDAEIKIGDGFTKSYHIGDDTDRLKQLATGTSKESWGGSGITAKGVVKTIAGGIAGTVGAVLGFAAGTVYAASIVPPLIAASVCWECGENFGNAWVRQMVSPLTASISLAKSAYGAVADAVDGNDHSHYSAMEY